MDTYEDRDGEEQTERRRRDRSLDDHRIEHLFNGFDNLILNAKESGDLYGAGYVKAMRDEFASLVKDRL